MKVGIFGGTFNPPHNTHISIVSAAVQQLGLDKVFVVPCGIPPHKKCDVDAATRLQLARLAFSRIAEVTNCEIAKEGKSYTVETLRLVRQWYPDAQLFLIIGGDSFRNFDSWYCPQEIATLATLAVADRSHKTFNATKNKIFRKTGAEAIFLNVEPNKTSSTEIRLRYQFGLDNSQFVPHDVDQFVLSNNLYSQYREMAQKLATFLSEKRFMHTFYVVKRGLELATEDKDRVFVACLLHDCAKYIAPQDYGKYGFVAPQDMPQPVIHSFLGKYVARQEFGITDEEILEAIAFHTTGCPNMTTLQKIVYVADKTEETRNYPISHLTEGSLDSRFKKCLIEANTFTSERHGDNLYWMSQKTMDFYFPNGTH